MIESDHRWGLIWYSKNRLDGVTTRFIYENYMPVIFRTRKDARKFNELHYGYIKTRKDLRIEPHGWRFPRTIKIKIVEVKK